MLPSFVFVRTADDDQGLEEGRMTTFWSTSVTSLSISGVLQETRVMDSGARFHLEVY